MRCRPRRRRGRRRLQTNRLDAAVAEEIAGAVDVPLKVVARWEWETLRDRRGEILASLIARGSVDAEEAAHAEDDGAWVAELWAFTDVRGAR